MERDLAENPVKSQAAMEMKIALNMVPVGLANWFYMR